MRSPLTSPQAPPTASPRGWRRAPASPPAGRVASTTPESASSEPTERSIPPERITNVMPSGDHGVDARLLHHVEQVRDGEEVRGEDGEEHDEGDQADQGAQLARAAGGGAFQHAGLHDWPGPRAKASTSAWVVRVDSSSATTRPPRMTSTRSLMPSTSGSSEEIIRMPLPSAVRRFMSS